MSKKDEKTKKTAKFNSLVVPCGTVFMSSFCIMVLELVAGRIIARYLGSSLYTWTSVIGVVLTGITLGNYFGGRIADRFQPRKTLAVLFAICSAACVVTIILNNLVGDWNWLWYLSWPKHVFVHVTLVFLLPSLLLGTISPVVAKMALDRGLPTGRTVGDIYAWGAAGSIIGTFVTGYWLIAAMGTVAIIWLVGAALLLMAILYWIRLFFLHILALVFSCLWLMGMGPWQWSENAGAKIALRKQPNPAIVYENESQYCYIAVERNSKNPNKRKFLQDRLEHSEMIVGNTTDLQYSYAPIFAAATIRLSAEKDKLSTLLIGGGGYVFPRYIESVWPGSHIDVVEIDPAVTQAAIEAFGLDRDTPINTHTMDARIYVDRLFKSNNNNGQDLKYDFIYGDAINDYSVPFQLVTTEFNEKVAKLLTEDGAYMINLVDIPDSGLFLGAFLNTLEKTFPYIEVILEADVPSTDRNTIVIVASGKKLHLNEIAKEYTKKKLHLRHLTEAEINQAKEKANGLVLTDDYVPVENLLAPVVSKSGIGVLVKGYTEHAEKLAQNGRFDESIEMYQKIPPLKSSLSVKIYNCIAGILGEQGKFQEEIEFLEKAVQYNAQAEFKVPMGSAHYNLATALRKSGEPKEADYHFGRATE